MNFDIEFLYRGKNVAAYMLQIAMTAYSTDMEFTGLYNYVKFGYWLEMEIISVFYLHVLRLKIEKGWWLKSYSRPKYCMRTENQQLLEVC